MDLKVRAPAPRHWLQDLSSHWGAQVKVHTCRPVPGDPPRLLQLFEVSAPARSLPEISLFFRQNVGVGELSFTKVDAERMLVRMVTPTPALCLTVFDVGAICINCPFISVDDDSSHDSDDFTWRLLAANASCIPPLLSSFRTPGASPPTILRVRKLRLERKLTARQEVALETAVRLGYYEVPRRAGLGDVAKALGVSRATAMEILRRGVQNLTAQWKRPAPPTSEEAGPHSRP